MTDPYRDQHRKCLACNEALREFHGRWVCDACGGMMMSVADLSTGIFDMTSVEPELVFVEDVPSKRLCPHCEGAMVECKVRITIEDDVEKPRPTLDRCAAHGLWFDPQELAAVLATIARKGHGSANPVMASSRAGDVIDSSPRPVSFKISSRFGVG